MAHTIPHAPRPFTAAEQTLRQRAQQHLLQKRLNAQTFERQGEQAFRRALRSTEQPTLFTAQTPVHTAAPPAPPVNPVLPATLEAAMDRVRRPRPGTPAAWAVEAVERARSSIETHVRRRDARHNTLMVYRALAQAAYTLIQIRSQQHAHTTTYTYFTVMDLLPAVTGLSSDQCERATRRLQDLGLIHKTSGALPTRQQGARHYQGGTWVPTTFLNAETGEKITTKACAGTWVAVVLRPAPGLTARVISHELPPCPRDLTTDRKTGRTAWQFLQEAKTKVRESFLLSGDKFDITPLLQWSLPEHNQKSLGTVDSRTSLFGETRTPQDLVWSLSRIASVHPHHRREAVQEGAARLVTLLSDTGWERHYYRVLWRATEAEFRGVPAYAQLAAALQRTLVSTAELNLNRPGAWLMHQLRECGWLDNVYHVNSVTPHQPCD